MPGAPDPAYIAARRTLLDALEGLGPQRESVVLVGAQAIYLHTGEDDGLAVAPFTTDADLSLDPDLLRPEPRLEQAMSSPLISWLACAGYSPRTHHGASPRTHSPDCASCSGP